MADQLATVQDLASLLQSDLDLSSATLAIEMATAVVQEACGNQRIVQVVDDVLTIMGTTDSWLPLPQIPVTAVSSVVLDGVTLTAGTDYKLFGNRLWRAYGWQNNIGVPWQWPTAWPHATLPQGYPVQQPSTVVVTYTHGYPPGSQDLELARQAVLSLAKTDYSNPAGVASESIDDYSVTFRTRLENSQHLNAALKKKYGRRAGLVRIG